MQFGRPAPGPNYAAMLRKNPYIWVNQCRGGRCTCLASPPRGVAPTTGLGTTRAAGATDATGGGAARAASLAPCISERDNFPAGKMGSIRNLRVHFLSLLACIAVAGCSSMHAQQVASLLDPYVGQPASELVNRFGPPSSNFASSAVETTYEWDNFDAGPTGMTGCRVLVVASRGVGQDVAAASHAFGTDPISPEEFWKWTIKSWSSVGTGCR